jgi:cytochrome c peroxidase
MTAPYMHDGSLQTLTDVVRFYNAGGTDNPFLDKGIKPLGLSGEEQEALVEFLRSLTSDTLPDMDDVRIARSH